MEAFCINLDREPQRFEMIKKEFSGILFFTRVSAIDGKKEGITGWDALHQTNVKLFNELVLTDRPYYIICEDDIYKYVNFKHYWPKIVQFINNPSNVWDFISLDFILNVDKPSIEIYTDFLYKVGPSRATGFMIYNAKFVKNNLSYLTSAGCLDMTMKHNPDFIKLIPHELIVKQVVNKLSETCNKNTHFLEYNYDRTVAFLKSRAPQIHRSPSMPLQIWRSKK